MPKNILGSVGEGGANQSQSVKVIQYLLNCVPGTSGGPGAELAVDGMIGPKTIAAIKKFQMTKFGRADGRVDLNGPTLKALQGFDPYPNEGLGHLGHKSPDKFGDMPGYKPRKGDDWLGQKTGEKFGGMPGQKYGDKTGGLPGQKTGMDGYKTGFKDGYKTGFKDGYKSF